MKTAYQTKLLIMAVKKVFRDKDSYRLFCESGNADALEEAADFREWLPQQTEAHFAQPIEEAIENNIPADAISLANYVLWFYADPAEQMFNTVTFQEI
jgi:hypothetical protein